MARESPSILLVEDEPTLTGILTTMLRQQGYSVQAASTAENALALATREKFDLVITDKNLPGRSGLALASELRRSGVDTRLMLITGYPSVAAAQEALDAGFLAFLVKPFRHLRDAADEVARVLAIRHPQDRLDGARRLRERVVGGNQTAPPISSLIIAPEPLATALASRLGAINTVKAADWANAQDVLTNRRLASVVGLDVTSLAQARDRMDDAFLLMVGDPSFADTLELIRLGAVHVALPAEMSP